MVMRLGGGLGEFVIGIIHSLSSLRPTSQLGIK